MNSTQLDKKHALQSNGNLDLTDAPKDARELAQDFLNRGHKAADSLADLKPGKDQFDAQSLSLKTALKNIELLLENGEDLSTLTHSVSEAINLYTKAAKVLEAHSLKNPLGIHESQSKKPNTASVLTFTINKGDEFSYNYKRQTSDGGIAYMNSPYKVSGNVVGISDPSVGLEMKRRPDPKDPTKEIITIDVNKSFKGYLELGKGGESTFVNVQNNRDNQHLKLQESTLDIIKAQKALTQLAESAAIKPLPDVIEFDEFNRRAFIPMRDKAEIKIVSPNGSSFELNSSEQSKNHAGISLNRIPKSGLEILSNFDDSNLITGRYKAYQKINGQEKLIFQFDIEYGSLF